MILLKEMFKGFVLSSYLNHAFISLSHVLISSLEQFVRIWWKVQLAHSRITSWPPWSSESRGLKGITARGWAKLPGRLGTEKSGSRSLWLLLLLPGMRKWKQIRERNLLHRKIKRRCICYIWTVCCDFLSISY